MARSKFEVFEIIDPSDIDQDSNKGVILHTSVAQGPTWFLKIMIRLGPVISSLGQWPNRAVASGHDAQVRLLDDA